MEAKFKVGDVVINELFGDAGAFVVSAVTLVSPESMRPYYRVSAHSARGGIEGPERCFHAVER